MSFGFYEHLGRGGKVRAYRDLTFPTVQAAIAHFGDKIIEAEVAEDGQAADIFTSAGQVLAVEPV